MSIYETVFFIKSYGIAGIISTKKKFFRWIRVSATLLSHFVEKLILGENGRRIL